MLGDSTMAGYPSTTGGFRLPLKTLLSSAGKEMEFCGSQDTYNPPCAPISVASISLSKNIVPQSTLLHEGHNGATSSDIISLLPDILNKNKPDIIVLNPGLNDFKANISPDQTSSNYTAIFDQIYNSNPNAIVVVSSFVYSNVFISTFSGYVTGIFNTVNNYNASHKTLFPIDFVNNAVPDNNFVDGIHLLPSGNNIIGLNLALCLGKYFLPNLNEIKLPLSIFESIIVNLADSNIKNLMTETQKQNSQGRINQCAYLLLSQFPPNTI